MVLMVLYGEVGLQVLSQNGIILDTKSWRTDHLFLFFSWLWLLGKSELVYKAKW